MKNTKIITIANLKGGVGKPTTALALTHKLAEEYKVLLIDADKQGNATDGMTPTNKDTVTLYDVITGACPLSKSIIKTQYGDVLPSNIKMVKYSDTYKDTLTGAILEAKKKYDYIIIDTPPEINNLTNCIFNVSDYIILTTIPNHDALKGIQQELINIKRIQATSNQKLKVNGILLTMYNARSLQHQEYTDIIRNMAEMYNTSVYNTQIPRSTAIEYAKNTRTPIYKYSPRNKAVASYTELVIEIMKGI